MNSTATAQLKAESMPLAAEHTLQRAWSPAIAMPTARAQETKTGSLRQRIQYCTLTGIDDGVPLETLVEMARRHPYAEFGVLYSSKLQGRGRYPSLAHISHLAREKEKHPELNLALHVCGSAVSDLLEGSGHVSTVAHAFPRIQLNMVASQHDLHYICDLLDRLKNQTVITQYNPNNKGLWRSLSHKWNHAVLFDESGGKGIEPEAWSAPLEITSEKLPFKAFDPLCGYAGGLSPTNIAMHLRLIAQVTGADPFWVDLETNLRDPKDRFCVGLAQQCLDAVASVIASPEVAHDS